MTPQRMGGIVLLIVGAILLYVGMQASNSIADQVSNTFTGRFTQATTWYIISGIVACIFGIFLSITNFSNRSAK